MFLAIILISSAILTPTTIRPPITFYLVLNSPSKLTSYMQQAHSRAEKEAVSISAEIILYL